MPVTDIADVRNAAASRGCRRPRAPPSLALAKRRWIAEFHFGLRPRTNHIRREQRHRGNWEIQPMNDFELPITRYAQSGDVNIAYQTMGDGPIDLIIGPGIVSPPRFAADCPGA